MVAHHRAADGLFVASSGEGPPLLESVAARPPRALRGVARASVLAVLPVTAVLAIIVWLLAEGRAGAFLTLAAIAAAAVVLVFVFNASSTAVVLRAGARAVAEVNADGGEGIDLPLYELRSISVTNSPRGLALRLVGPDKRRLTLPFGMLETNQQLWDLVYNGIRHSEAAGADIDVPTRQRLRLPPRPPS